MSKDKRVVKVAVIGSGLAGLTATYLLENNPDNFEVHLFEKGDSLGMDAASVSVGPKKEFRIDVPMRYYSHLFKLYTYLKIPIKKAKFSFGWYRIMMQPQQQQSSLTNTQLASHTQNESYLIYSGARTIGHLDKIKTSTATETLCFLWRSLIVATSYLWLLFLSVWLHYGGYFLDTHQTMSAFGHMTLETFFKTYHVHPFFVHHVFVPLFAAVCTTTFDSMLQYPAADVLEYLAVGLFQESYVVACGVQEVVRRISKPFRHVHLQTAITKIESGSEQHRFRLTDQHGNQHDMDHLIFATQGNQAQRLLSGYVEHLEDQGRVKEQIDVLRAFPYEPAIVINHTDTRLLPSNPHHWKALNLAVVDVGVPVGSDAHVVSDPHQTTMATHILNMTHDRFSQDDVCYLQTTNPCLAVDPEKLLSVAHFERATVTVESKRALRRLFVWSQHGRVTLGPCQGVENGIWFVGSYCWKGIPLLEGCVASAELVVEGLAEVEQVTLNVKCAVCCALASSGDRQVEYVDCVERCASTRDLNELSLHLRLLRWTVRQDCGYHCMQAITQRALANDDVIHQYHGKWPFHRLLGIQEPASVLFSILNGLMHLHYFKQIRRYVSARYPLRTYYLGIAVVGMNAWLWSTVFHMRDTPLTEKLDYFSAGLYILYGLYVAVIRIGYLHQRPVVWLWSLLCGGLYVVHLTYLSRLPRFDYSYNMIACIVVGSCQTLLWLFWSLWQYTRWGKVERRPFAWMAGLFVVLISAAMALEVFDFPPLYLVLDAHSLWHAATIPLAPFFYRFLLRDTECETVALSRLANDKRSS
ncbi:MAG: Per1-like-domain-containing protein [Benjaminiella poitrasii]|nr:MAG: Per1-like-domain-containing protein [Benjaminiella poitrasii]